MPSPTLTRFPLVLASLWLLAASAVGASEVAPRLLAIPRSGHKPSHQWHQASLERRASNATVPLRNVQVAHPPVVPKGGRTCEVVLVQHDFANSYYAPAIVDYTPPVACGAAGEWAAIVLNITVTSNGTQFDRLGSISLSNVEIWRTSTAEPTKNGIIWTTLKDVTHYNPIFAKEGRLMFDENNVNDDTYTGIFTTTLSATFYESTSSFPTPKSADLILPLSTLSTTESQMFTYPGASSTNITIPNTAEAYLEIYATGNGDEEFWYTNLPDEFSDDFDADDGLIAKGPFREVQLLIDGELAGVVIPFPVIYTGGAQPLLWRPIASLRAYDIPSFYIDVTPFIPDLTDSQSHNFTLIVLGQGVDHSVNANWLSYVAAPYATTSTSGGPSSDNKTISTSVTARRTLEISALVTTGSGSKVVSFSQVMSYSNGQKYSRDGETESVEQKTKVAVTSTHGTSIKLSDVYSFPLTITTNYEDYPSGYSAAVGPYEYDRVFTPPPTAGSFETTKSSQTGSASISLNAAGTAYVGNSATSETYAWFDAKGNTFQEEIKAVNSSIVSDSKSGSLSGSGFLLPFPLGSSTLPIFAGEVVDGLAQIVGVALRPMAGKLARQAAAQGGPSP
ncbi:hypothetical protein RQP46_004257 [Phenoliferia psychrophenolica]